MGGLTGAKVAAQTMAESRDIKDNAAIQMLLEQAGNKDSLSQGIMLDVKYGEVSVPSLSASSDE